MRLDSSLSKHIFLSCTSEHDFRFCFGGFFLFLMEVSVFGHLSACLSQASSLNIVLELVFPVGSFTGTMMTESLFLIRNYSGSAAQVI